MGGWGIVNVNFMNDGAINGEGPLNPLAVRRDNPKIILDKHNTDGIPMLPVVSRPRFPA
jgi:hypothetical protein